MNLGENRLNRVSQDPAYRRLKDHLIASTGLAFYAGRDEPLTDVIAGRLAYLGLPDCSSYADKLAEGEKGNAEMEVLIGQLTIGETYFFRDEELFAALRNIIFPDILERKQVSRQLRIWSAGCATGAEPYSLAILLSALTQPIAGWQVGIFATDLNRSYLAQAASGKFREAAFRTTSDKVKDECFSREGRIWTVHSRYKQWISFHQMNLVESGFSTPWPRDTHFDLILCRNVMIYFAPEEARRLVGNFHEALEDDGWLVVGASEHNLENYRGFRTVLAPGAKAYQKVAAARGRLEVAPVAPGVEPPAVQALDVTPRRPVAAVQPSSRPAADASPAGLEGLRQLVDRGDWQDAAAYGRRLLAQDRLNAEIHFYNALTFEKLGMAGEPERSLRQALYLNRNFAMAHYHLGLVLKRDRQMRAAHSFGNVLKALAGMPDRATVAAGPGVTVANLRELARMQLESPGGL
jgi:chemotaxis protein methyltransferase CheR